jgi:salicylate hydroxylase
MAGLSVAIVGGGIGGTAAALSLLRSGLDVQIYEQARELREVGAGIQISPNASRVLHRLGLSDGLSEMGVNPLAWHQRRWQDGRTLLHTPLAEAMEAAFGSPHYQMHRADVLRTLSTALPPERVHIDHRLTSFVDHCDRVEAEFENGARICADVLAGADGIHSTVRRILFGPEQPRFTGCMCYRGLVPAERLAHLKSQLRRRSGWDQVSISSTTMFATSSSSISLPLSIKTLGPGSHGLTAGT